MKPANILTPYFVSSILILSDKFCLPAGTWCQGSTPQSLLQCGSAWISIPEPRLDNRRNCRSSDRELRHETNYHQPVSHNIQSVSFIVPLSTRAATICLGGYRFSMRRSYRARGHDKRDTFLEKNNQQMHRNCVSFLKIYLFNASTCFGYSLTIIRVLVIWYNEREQYAYFQDTVIYISVLRL
jgi:hypothetical protein